MTEQALTGKALRAGFFVAFSYGLSQVLRLAGNMVLTRLLVPEFFGLIAIANIFIHGLNLFSDFGIEPAVIRSPRADEENFLNTAWSIQILRGLALLIISVLIAYPVALFYEEPVLARIVPVIGLLSMFIGFNSTVLITLNKELQQGKLTYIELVSQVISLVVMIVLAYYFRNVWSLVAGGLLVYFIKMIWSHAIKAPHRNRWHLEREALKEIFSFGKWILLSTAMMFLASQSDRLFLGKLFPMALLGVYSIAVIFAELPKQLFLALNGKVLFPLINNFAHLPHEDIRSKIHNPRRIVLVLLAILVGIFTCFGDYLILFLYDERYHQAAWMLPILAIGTWPLILHSTNNSSLMVVGKPQYQAYGNTAKFIYMLIMIPVSFRLFGVIGTVIVVGLNDIPVYIVMNIGMYRHKLSDMKQDAVMTSLLIFVILLIIWIRIMVGLGAPGSSVFHAASDSFLF